MNKLEDALRRIDAANSEDPNQEAGPEGPAPKELLYGRRMSAWLEKLRPDAPEALQIAVRAQHIRRWEIPRDSYPMDRKGYLKWRRDLARFHADTAAAILDSVGFDAETVERVRFLLQKKQLHQDPDTQSLEDAACLVFLEHHIEDFAARTDPEKMLGIVQKTWNKMSKRAQGYALTIQYSPEVHKLLKRALSAPPAQ